MKRKKKYHSAFLHYWTNEMWQCLAWFVLFNFSFLRTRNKTTGFLLYPILFLTMSWAVTHRFATTTHLQCNFFYRTSSTANVESRTCRAILGRAFSPDTNYIKTISHIFHVHGRYKTWQPGAWFISRNKLLSSAPLLERFMKW